MKRKILLTGAAWLAVMVLAAESVVMERCSDAAAWQKNGQEVTLEAAAGPAADVAAIRIAMPGKTAGAVTRTIGSNLEPGREKFNAFQGISFYVKGDGSDVWSCIALEGPHRYLYFFPLKSTEWTKYTVPWRAFAPEGQYGMIGDFGSMPPAGIVRVRFGCRWNIGVGNQPIPAHSFSVADIRWESEAPPLPPAPAPASFQGVLDKLKSGAPVRIQCMGDSVTAGTGLPDKEAQRYAVLLGPLLERYLGRAGIEVWSESVGGAGVNDLRGWINRDFAGGAPDLVTVWIGYNDKSRGHTAEYFRDSLAAYLDDVARVTGGRSAILLFTTTRGAADRWEMQDDFAAMVRQLAADRKLPCFDINAIQKRIGFAEFRGHLVDTVHPNVAGHEFIARELAGFLLEQAGLPRPPAAAGETTGRDSESDRRSRPGK